MLTITTETRRFVLKENEEQSEKKFNEIIRKLLELQEEIIDDKKPQETENTNRQQEEKPSGTDCYSEEGYRKWLEELLPFEEAGQQKTEAEEQQ